jgi:hypothetical protein
MTEETAEEIEVFEPEIENEDQETEVNEIEEESEIEDQADEDQSDEENEGNEEIDEDEVIISIEGQESPPDNDSKEAPQWVKEVRQNNRKLAKENRELKARLEQQASTENKPVQLGQKPTLESCDYDEEAFETQLTQWHETKRQLEQQEEEAAQRVENERQAWHQKLENYSTKRQALKVRDFDEAEEVIQQHLSHTQIAMIIQAAEDPALVNYAIGKNPKKAEELAKIKDPVKFAYEAGKLEAKLKVTNRKAATKPEKKITGNASVSGSVDSNLERLRAEAEKTGDYSKVMAFKRQQRNKK